MSPRDPLREVLLDARTELRERRAQVLAGLTYLVFGAGGLVLFSSIGEDSGQAYDTVDRTTLTAVGIGLLASDLVVGAVTLAVDRDVRRRVRPGAVPRHVQSRRRVIATMACAAALLAAGLLALSAWS